MIKLRRARALFGFSPLSQSVGHALAAAAAAALDEPAAEGESDRATCGKDF
jgi:hypothetical protein